MQNFQEQIRECNSIDWDTLFIGGGRPLGGYTGTDNPKARFTDKKILELRKRVYSGDITNSKDAAKLYNMSLTNVRRIIRGATWTHLPFDRSFKWSNIDKLTDKDRATILLRWRNRFRFPVMQKELAREYGVTPAYISKFLSVQHEGI